MKARALSVGIIRSYSDTSFVEKMQPVTIFSAISLASVVLAAPLQTCLSYKEASCIVEKYIGIADGTGYDNQSANATAQALISDDFTGDSGSILSLQERPVKD